MKTTRFDKQRKSVATDRATLREMTGLERGYKAPSKKVWNGKRWDTKCKADFTDYAPKAHPNPRAQ